MRAVGSIFFTLLIVGGLVAIVYGVSGRRDETVVQPIIFNHAVHLDAAGLDCIQCHTDAESDVHAGLPGKDICLDCHDIDEEEGTHPEKDRLFSYDQSEQDIPWQRVAVTRPDVFFSHRRHVVAAELACLRCHAEQPTLAAPPSRVRLVMSMTACIECHKKMGASSDCLACHR